MTQAKTLFSKVWEDHLVVQEPDCPAVLYIDLHLVHEVTSPQAFAGLKQRGLNVRRPDLTIATMDHSISTESRELPVHDPLAARQLEEFQMNCEYFGVRLYDLKSSQQGIVHVISPELGLTQPGMTIVCGDSHTSTHGAFGALAFGIGTSEVEHVLATQCLLQAKPKTMQVSIEGKLNPYVTAKDVILALIEQIGVGGGTGHVIEFTGPAIRDLNMEGRMTICNMAIEAGARAGMIGPDDITYEYLANREYVPKGRSWESAVNKWQGLSTDDGAVFDRVVSMDASSLEPMITFGTNPGMAMPITRTIPDPGTIPDLTQKVALEKALRYMDLQPGVPLVGKKIDVVFIGSCTNSRITDLRQVAMLMQGRKVSSGVRVLVVPGSQTIKRQAEAEGLDRVFTQAGAEWREAGCSMCIAMNGDRLLPGQYCVSTSNRNFEGRQGKGGRTFLASPLTAAAAAIAGEIADVRLMFQ